MSYNKKSNFLFQDFQNVFLHFNIFPSCICNFISSLFLSYSLHFSVISKASVQNLPSLSAHNVIAQTRPVYGLHRYTLDIYIDLLFFSFVLRLHRFFFIFLISSFSSLIFFRVYNSYAFLTSLCLE